jgi:hypothetical protein
MRTSRLGHFSGVWVEENFGQNMAALKGVPAFDTSRHYTPLRKHSIA